MSKRLSKRQLREQQELQTLGTQENGDDNGITKGETATKQGPMLEGILETAKDDSNDKGEEAFIEKNANLGLFSQLADADESAEVSNTDSEEKNDEDEPIKKTKAKNKKKKRRRKPVEGAEIEEIGDVNKLKNVKSKSKTTDKRVERATKDVSNMSMDEFSAILASQILLDENEVRSSSHISGSATKLVSGPLPSLRAHLSLSAPFLDPAVELKRQFGAAAIKAYENEANSSTGRGTSASASARARSMAWNTNFKVKSILVQPQETWPPIGKTFTGMTMETMEDDQRGKIGGWVHSRAYRKAQLQFLQAVQSYEPNHLISLLRLYPWHIDTLLQLSDVSRHQGDLGAASDWNARALFAFERTSTTVFSSSLTSQLGPPLLNFDRIEDRSFWIACHRHINFMGRRGTWRTALEWVKLMLGLDPTNDHHGMILWLDFLSIKSRQHAWFLECLQKMEAGYSAEMESKGEYIVDAKTPFDDDKELIGESKGSRGALDWCLGCAYARALAWRAIEKEEGDNTGKRSTAALRIAIARHPQLLPLLFDKIGLTIPSEIKSSSFFDLENADRGNMPKLLAHIYVSRSESLWRDSDVSKWLLITLEEAWTIIEPQMSNICLPAVDENSRMGIYRHILVSDLPDALRQTLIGLIPREITSNSSMLNAYDPLPPFGSNVTRYDEEYFESVTRERTQRQQQQHQAGQDQAGLMNQFMNAIRGVRGLEGWTAAMNNMDEESRADAMAQILQMTAEARGQTEGPDGMPGSFHVPDDQDQHQQQRQDHDGTEVAETGAFNALRRLLGNLWGQEEVDAELQRRADDEDEEDEEDVEQEQ